MPKLTIIVPAYGVVRYLPHCLDSILAQTYRDFELLVIDDGSVDGSGAVADEYAQKDARVRVIHKKNAGLPQARRTGLAEAKGDYIGFVDGDDYVEPSMYATLFSLLEAQHADMACCGYSMDYEDGRCRPYRYSRAGGCLFTGKEALRRMHRQTDIMPFMWNKIYARRLFDGVRYSEGNPVGEDYFIQIQVLEKAETVAQTDTPLYHYIQRNAGMSHSGYNEQRGKSFAYFVYWSEYLQGRHPEITREIHAYRIKEELAILVSMGRNGVYDPSVARQIQAHVRQHLGALLRSNQSLAFKVSGILTSLHNKLLVGASSVLNKQGKSK